MKNKLKFETTPPSAISLTMGIKGCEPLVASSFEPFTSHPSSMAIDLNKQPEEEGEEVLDLNKSLAEDEEELDPLEDVVVVVQVLMRMKKKNKLVKVNTLVFISPSMFPCHFPFPFLS
jgi:hypothetical protein